ncbi:MAG: histidine phosphatase family protein [Acidimicrobiia bacterium]|nr:histidine phosphatase family protein [Acidimicrobiia bacterium]
MHLHLVRHGEVHNPEHVVYAALDGYRLSALGRKQAVEAGEHLADAPVSVVVSSPLERAMQTASAIAFRHDLEPEIEPNLTEWGLATRWAGVVWENLHEVFPGELEAYLAHPHDLPFSPESISEVALRMTIAADKWSLNASGDVVLVAHQDPVQALRLSLTGRSLDRLLDAKPGHASVTTLRRSGSAWEEIAYWEPDGSEFPPTTPSVKPVDSV